MDEDQAEVQDGGDDGAENPGEVGNVENEVSDVEKELKNLDLTNEDEGLPQVKYTQLPWPPWFNFL